MTVGDILEYLNELAPLDTAEGYDNVGLLVGDADAEVTGVCCCVDITHAIIKEAAEKGANLIVSHHPVIFEGLKQIPTWSPVVDLIKQNIAAVAMHTNFDVAKNGVNETLVELLEFESESFLDKNYGAVCEMPLFFTPRALAEHCRAKLDLDCVKFNRKDADKKTLSRVAVCCGGGVDREIMRLARENDVDAIISGDIKHNFWIEAENCGITLIDAGHFGTEKAAAHSLAKLITLRFSEVPIFSAESEQDPCGYSC